MKFCGFDTTTHEPIYEGMSWKMKKGEKNFFFVIENEDLPRCAGDDTVIEKVVLTIPFFSEECKSASIYEAQTGHIYCKKNNCRLYNKCPFCTKMYIVKSILYKQ